MLRSDDEQRILAALQNWSSAVDPDNPSASGGKVVRNKLEAIASDKRPAVAAAAKAALERLPPK